MRSIMNLGRRELLLRSFILLDLSIQDVVRSFMRKAPL